MNSNIKKFDSKEAFDTYRATDGWAYPSVNYITNNEESSIHYNKEFIMEWNDSDLVKTPSFYGDLSYDEFKDKIDNLSTPCEIKKDGTDYSVLYMDGNTVSDYSKRTSTVNSHYNTEDKTDYLQMARIKNVNVGLFKDTVKGTKQVRFNFDEGCPAGFHKWFPNSTTGYKLFGRYDIMPNSTAGVDCCYGQDQTGDFTWSANTILSRIKATGNGKFLAETYWEHLVMSYLFCAYHKTFNTQDIYQGISTGNESAARSYSNGSVDPTVKTHDGGVSVTGGVAYKFLHLENPLHGKQWIWGAGMRGVVSTSSGKYYLTFDDNVANEAATLPFDKADITGTFVAGSSPRIENITIDNIDLMGMPITKATGTSYGFQDAIWAYNEANDRVAYLGGTSLDGVAGGAFARTFSDDAGYSVWTRRGRITMNE